METTTTQAGLKSDGIRSSKERDQIYSIKHPGEMWQQVEAAGAGVQCWEPQRTELHACSYVWGTVAERGVKTEVPRGRAHMHTGGGGTPSAARCGQVSSSLHHVLTLSRWVNGSVSHEAVVFLALPVSIFWTRDKTQYYPTTHRSMTCRRTTRT